MEQIFPCFLSKSGDPFMFHINLYLATKMKILDNHSSCACVKFEADSSTVII